MTQGESRSASPGTHDLRGYTATHDFHDEVDLLATGAGSRACREVVGSSVDGADIVAVWVAAPGRVPDLARPQAFVVGGMHGVEVISTELALHLLGQATVPGSLLPEVAAVLEVCDVTFVPALNIDGRRRSIESLSRSRSLFRSAPRVNTHGVDLNRNWPTPVGSDPTRHPLAGTNLRFLPWYRGPQPLSEPETKALQHLAERRPPRMLLNLHCNGELLVYPWSSRRSPTPDRDRFEAMATAFQTTPGGAKYQRRQSSSWYPIAGSSNDYFYDQYGTLAMTVELALPAETVKRRWSSGTRMFWWVNPDNPSDHVRRTAPGCWAAIRSGVDSPSRRQAATLAR